MRSVTPLFCIGLLAAAVQFACTPGHPERVNVPPPQGQTVGPRVEREISKPLPNHDSRPALPGPVSDQPLVSQHPPELHDYVQAYERVGRPSLLVQVQPAQHVDADSAAIATLLTDLLAADGQVTVLSPMNKDKAATADVLVQVSLEPITGRENKEGRFIAEAVNTKGGESIARAVGDVPMPLEKRALDDTTRFAARKLMDGMAASWKRMAVGMQPTQNPPPPIQPRTATTMPTAAQSAAPGGAVRPAQPTQP